MSLWWFSWVQGDRPKGDRFVGAAIVEGDDVRAALQRTHQLGINPGGEAEIVNIPNAIDVPEGWLDRRLNKEEAIAIAAHELWEGE